MTPGISRFLTVKRVQGGAEKPSCREAVVYACDSKPVRVCQSSEKRATAFLENCDDRQRTIDFMHSRTGTSPIHIGPDAERVPILTRRTQR